MSEEEFEELVERPSRSTYGFFLGGGGFMSRFSSGSRKTTTTSQASEVEDIDSVMNPMQEGLSQGWKAEQDENGGLFYIHVETQQITRVRPVENALALPSPMKKEISYFRIVREKRSNKKEAAVREKNKVVDFTKQTKRKKDFGRVRGKGQSNGKAVEMKSISKPKEDRSKAHSGGKDKPRDANKIWPPSAPFPQPQTSSRERISDFYKDEEQESQNGNDIGSFASFYRSGGSEEEEASWGASNLMRNA